MAAVNAEQIFEALWALADGPGVTVESVLDQPALMQLRYIVSEAQPGPGAQPTAADVASLVVEHIEAAASSIGTPEHEVLPTERDLGGAAGAMLGVGPGNGGLLAPSVQ
jgi:hypothetical protein